MSELGQFVSSIPPVTRIITLTSLVMGGLNGLGLITYSSFVCHWPVIGETWEFYRVLTGLLISHPQPMQGIMEIYMLYSFSKGLEEGKFKKNLPDYIFYHLIIVPIVLLTSYLALPPLLSLSPALLSALTFTWSVANYNQQVNFYFMPIKASLLPAVSLGFRLLVDGREHFYLGVTGMFAAYLYNCIETTSLGPLYSFLLGKEPAGASGLNNRVGTVNSVGPGGVWYFSTGYLPAPHWLKVLVSRLTGIDYTSKAFNRGGIAATPPKQSLTGTSSSGSSKSFAKRAFDSSGAGFRGKGQRLGSSTTTE